MRFKYKWNLKEANFKKNQGTVFSTFSCGGGSTMGYKLAGFDVLGCCEIDPKMFNMYVANHKPKHPYLESITTFKDRDDLPAELYDLDILDGSPPCSSFSMAGNREKDWGKEKKFREGQADQILDTLFFDFIDLAKKLQPKVVIAENVKGLLLGNAMEYVRKIYQAFDEAGYYCQHWLLDASTMGVPQRRERVFFVCLRKDLSGPFLEQFDLFEMKPKLKLEFNETPILFSEYKSKNGSEEGLTDYIKERLELMHPKDKNIGDINARCFQTVSQFNTMLIADHETPPTVTAGGLWFRKSDKKSCTKSDYVLTGSFPLDYDFQGNKPKYVIGMSVPPVMTAQIANQINEQWLKKIN